MSEEEAKVVKGGLREKEVELSQKNLFFLARVQRLFRRSFPRSRSLSRAAPPLLLRSSRARGLCCDASLRPRLPGAVGRRAGERVGKKRKEIASQGHFLFLSSKPLLLSLGSAGVESFHLFRSPFLAFFCSTETSRSQSQSVVVRRHNSEESLCRNPSTRSKGTLLTVPRVFKKTKKKISSSPPLPPLARPLARSLAAAPRSSSPGPRSRPRARARRSPPRGTPAAASPREPLKSRMLRLR